MLLIQCEVAMNPAPKRKVIGIDFFPVGYQYHRAPTPLPSEWENDLKEINRRGYTHVQYRPQWRWHERIWGKPVFEDLDRLFDLAKKYGLRVVLKPMLETAPDWVFSELNGTRIGFHGKPITPLANGAYYVGGWWPCFDNRKVIKAATEFTGKMVRRYRGHPALWFYDVWNEPVNRPMGACQCAESNISYRSWLKSRYGTIEEFNKKFGKAWTSYDTLMPPATAADYTEMFLWKNWSAFALSEAVKAVSDTIRKNDPKAFLMVHAGSSSITQDPIWGVNDDMQTKKSVDLYGTSFWTSLKPGSDTPLEYCRPELMSSWLKRVDPNYWCHEFYPNFNDWCVPPNGEETKMRVWMAVAGGAQAVTFWQYRSERVGSETNGFGAREIDGSETERSRALDGFAKIMKEHGGLIEGTTRVKSKAAVLFDRYSDMTGRLEKLQEGFEDLNNEHINWKYAYKQAVWRAHAIHMLNGEPADFVAPGDELSCYRFLHVTAAEMIDKKTASWLEAYVKNGGNLLVEFPFACRDEALWVTPKRPAHGLETLLGCSEGERHVSGEKDIAKVFGMRIPAGSWNIELIPRGGKVIGKWQNSKPAMIKNKFGKGTVWSTGFNASLAFKDNWHDQMPKYFRLLKSAAGIKPCSTAGKAVFVFKREGALGIIWFVFNAGKKTQYVVLSGKPISVLEQAGCSITGEQLKIRAGGVFVALFCQPAAG